MDSIDVILDGRFFENVSKVSFDCKKLDIDYTNGSGFFTSLPISPLEYRLSNPESFSATNVEASVHAHDGFAHFEIYDDWRELHTVSINLKFKDEILAAIENGHAQKILRLGNTINF